MIPRKLIIAVAMLVLGVFGLGLYLGRILRKVRQPASEVVNTRPVAPPVQGTRGDAFIYVADDTDGTLHRQTVSVILPDEPAKREREILRALVAQYQENGSAHPLGAGADITDVYLVQGTLAVVDANTLFADGHRSGILVEELTLASLAQTLAANLPGLTRMKLLVDGKERPTLAGHAGLTDPYNVAEAGRLVK